ncbi:alpha/beta fold hydrolase [Seohaeicola saemankumensis]|nr:alpha/beta fold hydrolase [Seohaeicola saemankumensis]MCA0873870.1 alpha/beta fold hydrolase [Seohaeicola saemankumensis]
MRNHLIAALTALATLTHTAPARAEAPASVFDVLASYYRTDPMPLESRILPEATSELSRTFTVEFRGFDREWVTGRLALPVGVANPPVVIAVHGITQSADQWWRMTGPYSFPAYHRQALLENGVAVLAIDARNHGARIETKDFPSAYAYLENGYFDAAFKMIAETALDVRRAIDFLETQDTVDATRLGYVGFSLGAHVGWLATATDDRITRSLLMGMPIIPAPGGMAPRFTEQQLYLDGLTDRPLRLLAAREDTFYSMEQVHQLFDAIPSQAKELIEIDGPHDMPPETARHSVEFLAAHL